jgi:hypothetical protein
MPLFNGGMSSSVLATPHARIESHNANNDNIMTVDASRASPASRRRNQ